MANKQDILNMLKRMANDQRTFAEYFGGEYSIEMLKNGEREKLIGSVAELQQSVEVLKMDFENKTKALEEKYKRSEDEMKARLNTLVSQIAEHDLRKAGLVSDIEALKITKLKLLDGVNEIKADKAALKKAVNV